MALPKDAPCAEASRNVWVEAKVAAAKEAATWGPAGKATTKTTAAATALTTVRPMAPSHLAKCLNGFHPLWPVGSV